MRNDFQILEIILVWSSINLLLATCSSTNETDRQALLAFKNHITGDPHGALSSWNNSLHHCQWNGVTCSRRHPDRVIILDLMSQKLEGTLSPNIGNLSFLRTVDLRANEFHGKLPKEIGHLFRLQLLLLANNSFSGDIPTNLTHCHDLRVIEVRFNDLSGGIPVELGSLSRLTNLLLAKNDLKGSLPSSLGNLTFLTKIGLSYSSLVGSIPDDLCNIRGLKDFNVGSNYLTGIFPSCFYNLSQMMFLAIGGNHLEGSLPQDIGFTLPNLKKVFIGNNTFRGPIPLSLSNASNLETIDLNRNQFTGSMPMDLGRLENLLHLNVPINYLGSKSGNDLDFITSLTNCSKLRLLSILGNSFKGLIPNSIANLSTQMTILQLDLNQIHGTIPSGIENLSKLTFLGFSHNSLTGHIPTSIRMFSQLNKLFLKDNHFSGEIPDSFSNLTLLEFLLLSGNRLHGRIPQSLGDCKNLADLDLSNNNLNGTIPEEVIGLSSHTYNLNLSNNALSGSLPSKVGDLSILLQFDVSRNRLSGHIPDTLGNCLTLVTLSVASNFFTGNIPRLRALKGLQHLDFSHNKLSGSIPQYLENFTSLTYLDLSYNELEGPVPKEGVFSNATNISVAGNSKLCGGVAELKLFQCGVDKKGKSPTLKVVVAMVSGIICLALLAFLCFECYLKRTSKVKPYLPSSSFNHPFSRITYAELFRATHSFCVDNLMGVGSYGSVYKGVLSESNALIAVKVFDLQQLGASKSFVSECNTMKNLRHRNLLKIITSCSSVDFQGNDFKAIIFEFMANRSLEEWLHPERSEHHEIRSLSFLERLYIAIDVAYALDYLHNHCQPTIIHCDLKPSNVLLDDDMTAHVADFGLAKNFCNASENSSQSHDVSSLAVRGSIGYVAPEYGIGSEVSIKGDVYSYGILLLEMFTGKRPSDGMFQDGQNIHSFAKMALSEHVMNIVDPLMLLKGSDDAINISNQIDKRVRDQCVVAAIKLGVKCSAQSPIERMNMNEVVIELSRIKDHHQSARVHLE